MVSARSATSQRARARLGASHLQLPRLDAAERPRQVDDTPYGGGAGMVLRVDVVDAALRAAYGDERPGRTILLAPARPAARRRAGDRARRRATTWRCSAVATRASTSASASTSPTTSLSVGPYVLSGGELAAMVVADAIAAQAARRARPRRQRGRGVVLRGARGRRRSIPHYTRPASYRGWEVPEVLLSGDHERIREWRLERSRERAEPSEGAS